MNTEEEKRLNEANAGKQAWRFWGPYLSERQWGTVREDYSENGHAWEYFPHEHALSRAYRWGEDGIGGISDEKQQLCFALSLWNGKDPCLKERLFGLTGNQGNHGEDVKEYYFYLDNLPSHAYMKYLYKYPQSRYPYEDLVKENGRRSRQDMEYELLDTGIFNEDKYFDIFIEYAKNTPEDILIKITAVNRGPETATLYLLPTLWFRNTWSWVQQDKKPSLSLIKKESSFQVIQTAHDTLANYWFYCDQPKEMLFTENETNYKKLYGNDNHSAYVKDGINDYILYGKQHCVNKQNTGTKASAYYLLQIKPKESISIKLRLSHTQLGQPFKEFEALFNQRINEANLFYQRISSQPSSEDMRSVQRQAFAGLLWNKQLYHYNVHTWLKGDPATPPPSEKRKGGRNAAWWNLDAYDIFSMPDKWEYPWFAAWDLAFHTVTLALIDPEFSKRQLLLLMREWYMYPDGQIPAYEWSFSDVNPPVQAWAAFRVYEIESQIYGRKDKLFLKKIFHKLLLNFTWWVNRKDEKGRNLFEGGFLGLDNIGVFNRSKGSPFGGILEQCDGTGWMGMYCLNLLQIALELSNDDPSYQDMAAKFFEHFIYIADAINNIAGHTHGLWDEQKGFYYGELSMPDGSRIQLSYDTIQSAIPLFAVYVGQKSQVQNFSEYWKRISWLINNRPGYVNSVVEKNEQSFLVSLSSPKRLQKILSKLLDEKAFLSPFGFRSVSAALKDHPYYLNLKGEEFTLNYEPAESTTPLFGGNSNWRGPVWFPLNFLLIESLQKFYQFLGNDFKIEFPTGSGNLATLDQITSELSKRLINIFLKDKLGKRAVYGGMEKFQNDPHWRDYILFHEYFHGDNGAGLGASNQTGWTALVATLIQHIGKK